jgi:hypothetical protein
MWLLLGVSQADDRNRWYTNEIADSSMWDKYILALYFVVTTMTTVGYEINPAAKQGYLQFRPSKPTECSFRPNRWQDPTKFTSDRFLNDLKKVGEKPQQQKNLTDSEN